MPSEARKVSRYWFVVTCPLCSETIEFAPGHPSGHAPIIRSKEGKGTAVIQSECPHCGKAIEFTPEDLRHVDLDAKLPN